VTAMIANRERRAVEEVACIEVLSIVGRGAQTGSSNDFHDRRRR
jgi:hypothetical protein